MGKKTLGVSVVFKKKFIMVTDKDTDSQLKIDTIITLVNEFLPKQLNLSHRKCLMDMGIAMCDRRSVSYDSLSFGLPSSGAAAVRRIERTLDRNILPALTISEDMLDRLLPHQHDLIVLIDRTQWKLGFPGLVDYNVLQASLLTPDAAIPYMGRVLDNKGGAVNGMTLVDFLEDLCSSMRSHSIRYVCADREFPCGMALRYLYVNHIPFIFRIKQDAMYTTSSDMVPRPIASVGRRLHCGQRTKPIRVFLRRTVPVSLTVAKTIDRKGKPQLICIISCGITARDIDLYADRWTIECSFRFLKSSGFRINKTHIRKLNRFAQLWRLAMIMAVVCWYAGRLKDKSRPIPILVHGRRAVSIFRYGLICIIETVKIDRWIPL